MPKKVFLVVFSIFVLSFAAATGNAQQQPESPTVKKAFDIGDPFKITKGSSFSASRTNQVAAGEGSAAGDRNTSPGRIMADVTEALDIIRANHVSGKRLNYADLNKSSIEAMLHVLDPHSNYWDAAEYRDMLTDQNSEYYGIGATIANYTIDEVMGTFVIACAPGSPADRAGLRFGDRIITVNGAAANGQNSFDVRERIRGAKGTTARLIVQRAATGKIENVDIRRGTVSQPSIPDAYMLRPGVGYIDFSNGFNYTTADELNLALADLHDQGMTSLVLDMRDNLGGILDQAVRVAEKFLAPGQIVVSQRGRFELDNRTFKAGGKKVENVPLVVLVNGNSASATEIVAGALQDHDRALIVGEQSFGKGLVQSIINLPGGTGLTLTTARYFTPSGRSIQRDYSKSGLYAYQQHKDNTVATNSPVSYTRGGRKVFSGAGIAPDEVVKAEPMTGEKYDLLDPVFAFSREVLNGRVAGLEGYRTLKMAAGSHRIKPADLPVNEDVMKAFETFVTQRGTWPIDGNKIAANRRFIAQRLRYNFIAAAFGSVTAQQVLVEQDPQVIKAVEALPRSRDMAAAASKRK